ncbi:ataxin-2-like protein isoform X1 [Mobula birostris]|uniref:ataxin-2-like protein isoform X1 n=1 Tax=Mobula birostris TaxID=1983395 RepID=UPI003B280134
MKAAPRSSIGAPPADRGRSSVKGSPQSPVFEGVYNNTRMLHFLTAVVSFLQGSTCDVRVRNGTVYEGIFKTLSSKLELAVDTVHRKSADTAAGPKCEDIIDTMIFKPSDVVVVQFRDVDLNYAMRDKLTDPMVSTKVNGEHRESPLQPWEGGGDNNSDDFDLESDVSNGWDANEMFRFNEETYGVKTTYDSSLSSYTTPLEKDNSAEFRQREARATQLAKEIESSPQYRVRVSMENDDGRTEEEKFSAVQRPSPDRDSPSLNSRDSKYIPLPQRSREGSTRGGGLRSNMPRGGRVGSLPPRGGIHHPDSSCSPSPDQRVINGGPSRMSPKAQRPTRGGKPLMGRGGSASDSSPHSQASGINRPYHPRSPKSSVGLPALSAQELPGPVPAPTSPPEARRAPPPPSVGTDTSGSPSPGSSSPKPATPAPSFNTDVKDLGSVSGKELPRPVEIPSSNAQELGKVAVKGIVPSMSDQKRNQIEELKKFGEDFRLQELGSAPSRLKEVVEKPGEGVEEGCCPSREPTGNLPASTELAGEGAIPPTLAAGPPPAPEAGERRDDRKPGETAEGALPAPPSPQGKCDGGEEEKEGMSEQVKKSTLNPNAKEFNPTKTHIPVTKPASTPTPPRPQTQPSPSIVVTPGQNAIYNAQYISYVHGIHMNPTVQGPQVYQYTIPPVQVSQSKPFRTTKGSVPPQRSEQHHPPSAPPIMQAASAAGPPLVAGPYSPPYLPYGPQQFTGQPAMMQAMAQYHSQPVYASMIQSNTRMIGSAPHPQAIVSSSGPQYPSTEQAPPQAMYVSAQVPQAYPHATPLHHHSTHPQPATTPTGNQAQGQHAAPSPVQQHQGSQPPHISNTPGQQSLYHAALTPTPPSITPAPNPQSPQTSFPQQAVYAIHPHQQLQHGYTNMAHVTQAHVQSGMAGPHHHPGPSHHTQVMLLPAPQTHGHGGPTQQGAPHSGVPAMSANATTHYTYIGHPQVPVQTHQQPLFHPQGN